MTTSPSSTAPLAQILELIETNATESAQSILDRISTLCRENLQLETLVGRKRIREISIFSDEFDYKESKPVQKSGSTQQQQQQQDFTKFSRDELLAKIDQCNQSITSLEQKKSSNTIHIKTYHMSIGRMNKRKKALELALDSKRQDSLESSQ